MTNHLIGNCVKLSLSVNCASARSVNPQIVLERMEKLDPIILLTGTKFDPRSPITLSTMLTSVNL